MSRAEACRGASLAPATLSSPPKRGSQTRPASSRSRSDPCCAKTAHPPAPDSAGRLTLGRHPVPCRGRVRASCTRREMSASSNPETRDGSIEAQRLIFEQCCSRARLLHEHSVGPCDLVEPCDRVAHRADVLSLSLSLGDRESTDAPQMVAQLMERHGWDPDVKRAWESLRANKS